jgi:hypothetical protein
MHAEHLWPASGGLWPRRQEINAMTDLRAAALIAACLAAAAPGTASADDGELPGSERDGPTLAAARDSGDSCVFFRSQAYSRGVYDFAAEMLAACEEIARRRASSSPLSDRLIATETMLNDYRAALIAAGAEAFARKRRGGEAPWSLGLSDAEKYAIADATGALLALEAIRLGF